MLRLFLLPRCRKIFHLSFRAYSSAHISGNKPYTPTHLEPSYVHDALLQANQVIQIIRLIKSTPELQVHFFNPINVAAVIEALSNAQNHSLCRRIIVALNRLDYKISHKWFETICHHATSAKNWNDVLQTVALCKKVTHGATPRLLNWYTLAVLQLERYYLLRNVLATFQKYSLTPDRRTFHLLITGHLRNRDLPRAKRCLTHMHKSDISPDSSTHAEITQTYRHLGSDPAVQTKALAEFHEFSPTVALHTLNQLVEMRLDLDDIPGTLDLLLLYEPKSVLPLFNLLGDEETGPVFATQTDNLPFVIPDSSTFSIFLRYFAKSKDFSSGITLIDHIKQLNISSNENLAVATIHLLSSCGDFVTPVQLVLSMRNASSISSFLSSLATPVTGPTFLDVQHLPVTARVFDALLHALGPTQPFEFFRRALSAMRSASLEPTQKTLEILVRHVALHGGSPRQTLEMLHLLRRGTSSLSPVTLRHMHILLSSVIRRQKRLTFRHGWLSLGRGPNLMIPRFPNANRFLQFDPHMDPLGGLRLPEGLSAAGLARPLMTSFYRRRVLSDAPAFALHLQHEAVVKGNLDAANKVFQKLLRRGMHPTPHHFAAIMEGYTRSGDIKSAEEAMEAAGRFGIKPGVVMFTIILVGHGREGRATEALRVFREMIASGLTPDVASVDALVGSFNYIGAHSMAKRVLLTFWPQVHPFPQGLDNTAPLLDLIRQFRSGTPSGKNQSFNDRERLILHQKIQVIMDEWTLFSSHSSQRTPDPHTDEHRNR